MTPKILLDKNRLILFYIKKGLSQEKTADALKCTRSIIRSNLKYYEIHIRNLSEGMMGHLSPQKGSIRNHNILEKISKKQKYITTDWDLSCYGYFKSSDSSNKWILKDFNNLTGRNYYKNHKKESATRAKKYNQENSEKVRIQKQKYYKCHKEKIKKTIEAYRKTPKGKLTSIRHFYKQKGKGFIPINDALGIPFDWHHLTRELPFVMAIDREIHKSVYGKNHYDAVNEQIGLTEIVGKSKEDIEYYIELNYPEEFKKYWFGDY